MKNFKVLTTDKIVILALLLLCLISFYPVFNAEYLEFDDVCAILNDNRITQPFTIDSIINIFSTLEQNQYTPLSLLSFWLEYNIFFELNSYISHAINLFLHILATFSLFYFSLNIFNNKKIALLISILWAIHPIQTCSVAWITGRRTILYGLFFISSLLFYSIYLNTDKYCYKYLSLFFMVLSGLSKTLAFSTPIVWLGIDWLKNRKFDFKIIKEKSLAFIISTIFISIMFLSANDGIDKNESDNAVKLDFKQFLFAIGYYPAKTINPCNISAINEINSNTKPLLDKAFYYFIVFITLAIIVSLKSKIALFGFIFYLFHIIPLSGLIRVGYPFFAVYHYYYIPFIGILFLLVEAIRLLIRNIKIFHNKKKFITILIILSILLSVKTYSFSIVYQSSPNIFKSALQIDFSNRFAIDNLVAYYMRKNKYAEVELYSKKMIDIHPNYYKGYLYFASFKMKNKDYKESIILLEKAKILYSKDNKINYMLSLCYIGIKNWKNAELYLNECILNDKYFSMAYQLRSSVRRKLGKYCQALEDNNSINILEPYNFENKVKLFHTSMQMINYFQSILNFINIYRYIKDQPEYIKSYTEVLFYPNFKESFFQCLPYYTYLDNLIDRIYNK